MKDAVLLLMHQGKSFTEEASEALRKRGLSLVALSSCPEKPETFEKSQRHLADWILTERPQLAPEDIGDVVKTFAGRGYYIRAAIATFEGYRLLMAELNRDLGARDSSPEALRRCLNKYQLRQFLLERQLSTVRCYRLSQDDKPRLDPTTTWFVKPVRGAASFATFILMNVEDLEDLPQIQQQMKNDHQMSAIFMDQYDFLVEEYIDGPEFSFETIVLGGAYHICVHEKARVECLDRTTLEAMSISPPICVDRDVVLAGADFVARCLTDLGLAAGAFHVEAKYWAIKGLWEIVEINPRMGGSLINASVKTLTGSSILELWLDSLLVSIHDEDHVRHRLKQVSQIESLREGTVSKATVFLSKYGEKGRTVDSIRFASDTRKPEILKLHAEAGTELENSHRAICLMDALWQVDYANLRNEVDLLDRYATEHFHVEYR